MSRWVFILPLLLLFLLPVCSLADNGEAPLTLLQKPQHDAQNTQNQALAKQDTELRDIHGPVPITEQPPYLLLATILIAVLLIVWAIYWYLKKRTKPLPPPIPPWEKALRELAEAKKLLRPEKALWYMDRVSQILRSYIEARFAIQSTRQTTREFFQGLTVVGGNSPLQAHKNELRNCLEQADMAKFAHHIPAIENLQIMEDAVTSFIKRTEPVTTQESVKTSKRGGS